ncbi:hypothetical protein A3B93_02205 [Candidatus Nomurabacteria bacterium RIFCSPHIGHO2_02_FULL_42_24]|uniref:SHS2 domain-containing protein n=1 Tax=Candidatus Nomurabacteria bacterium RIFCSPHIGHO2_02_FULL_42_24 TaxID=1801757 RepID=A0A1F6WIB3_9BACT|nr:MAG: hypothetical protein A3B93_02205 [Candidatus Nomurabacteria bacterium RIFCSPHIGHO2_02_FULL_42_24]
MVAFQREFFPPPPALLMPAVGLDISDRSIKFVELVRFRHGLRLGRFGTRVVPDGVIEEGKVKNPQKFSALLVELKRAEHFDFIRASLPEEQVYTFMMRVPKDAAGDINSAVEFQLEEYVPIPVADTVFSWNIANEHSNVLDIQVSATSRDLVKDYTTAFVSAGLVLKSLELETSALARAVLPHGNKGIHMLVDFGHMRTGIAIISNGLPVFTSTTDIGGYNLTSVIAKNFKIPFDEAEHLKKTYGLQRGTDKPEIFALLLNELSILRDEINKHYIYWHTHGTGKDFHEQSRIEKIILSGGDANIKGLVGYLSSSMQIDVELANAWINVTDMENYVPEITFNDSLSFAPAVGLALVDYF